MRAEQGGEPIKGLLVDSLDPDPNYRGPMWGDSKLTAIVAKMHSTEALARQYDIPTVFGIDMATEPDRHVEAIMIVGGESPHVLREAIAARAANPDATMMIGIQRRTHNGDAEAAFLERELANICLRPKAITNSGICVLGIGHPGDCEYE